MFSNDAKKGSGPRFVLDGNSLPPEEYGFTSINLALESTKKFMEALRNREKAHASDSIFRNISQEPLWAQLHAIAMVAAFFLVLPALKNKIPRDILDKVRIGMGEALRRMNNKINPATSSDVTHAMDQLIMHFANAVHKDLSNPSIYQAEDVKIDVCATTVAFSKAIFRAYGSDCDQSMLAPQCVTDNLEIQQFTSALFGDVLSWLHDNMTILYYE
ncbi:hypothetical protein KJ965_04810 [Patescibacteria group bacterium]|nr:hypothetical protein [Patescibacteria group bacterium]